MGIIRFAIDNPVKVAVGVILTTLFGLMSVFSIPIQLTPDVDRPVITVQTRWAGASPQEIESEIIDRQEKKLKSVTNLKKLTSTSQHGSGKIVLEFPVGVDKDIALRVVSDKLRQVSGYPEEVDEPVMSATDNDMAGTIAWIILYSKEGQDVSKLKTFIQENVAPQLERAEGISEVPVFGGLEREIQVVIDPHKLAARQLSMRDVERALRRQNANLSAGTIAQGKRDYTYRTIGEYRSMKDIERTVVAHRAGGPVLVRDVADVVDGFRKQFSFVRSKGRNVLALPARKETGANVIKAMANLKDRIAAVNKDILEPRGLGLELTQVYDETTYIWSAIGLVLKNILFGGALAVLVLMLFLRSGSATGIVAVAIPISVVGTFLIVRLLGRSLNVVMLAGLAFAVGMVVDNAIVVLENIYRHHSMGKSRAQAALDGAREVWGAVLASTLTTMAVFLPILTMQEEVGQLFKDIAIAIASAVGLSLIVSVLVIPPLASRFLVASRATDDKPWRFARWVASIVSWINQTVGRRLAVVCGLSIVAIVGSLKLAPASEYLPAGNQNLIFGFLGTPPGYSLEEFRRMASIVEDGDPNDPYDGVRPYFDFPRTPGASMEHFHPVRIPLGKEGATIRTVQAPPIENFFFVSVGGGAFMGCTSRDPTNVKPLVYVMTRAGSQIPGVFTSFSQRSLFGRGISGSGVALEIRGDDLAAVTQAAVAIQDKIMAKGFGYARPDPPNYKLGSPEIQIVPDREKSADLGLDVRDVGFFVEACVDGAFVGEYNDHGDKIDLVLKVGGLENASMDEIGRMPMYTPAGRVVTLDSIVRMSRTTAPQQINHIEEMSSVTLAVTPKTGVPLQDTMRELEEEIIAPLRASGMVPSSVMTVLAGTADKLTETTHALIGDFDDALQRPRLFGLSVGASIGLLVLLALAIVAGASIVGGARTGTLTGMVTMAALVFGLLLLNQSLALTLVQSRAVLALLITYLLMAALFESFLYPLVIMFTVPLATIGGFAALRLVHEVSLYDISSPIQQLDMLTMLGFVILVGIVVNNAILIVHQALNFMRCDGLPASQAVVRSVETRTRPIFMSAMTSVFGMAPLVVMPGAGSELYRGLGSVVLGGLLVSTVFTLVMVPAMFTLVLDARTWLGAAVQRSEAVSEVMPRPAPVSPGTES